MGGTGSGRRPGEKYYTPLEAIKLLFHYYPIQSDPKGYILEPCVGEGAISLALKDYGLKNRIITNDIDQQVPATMHRDASKLGLWQALRSTSVLGNPEWVITNPPFSLATEILQYGMEYSVRGCIFFLRLTYLEPCLDRDEFLYAMPPNNQIILPRISFTDDGRTDSVTAGWFIWDKQAPPNKNLVIIPRGRVREILNAPS